MKIIIIQGAFLPVPPLMGGAVEKMWFALGKEFATDGHQVIHISRKVKQLPYEEQIEGVLHKRVKGFDAPKSGLLLKLLDLIYSIRVKNRIPADADVIITNTFWLPVLLGKKLKKKCFVDVQRMPKGQMKLYKDVARLRANSFPVAEAIKNELPSDLYHKVVMVPNPLPFKTDISTAALDSKKNVLLYVGRVNQEKGLELAIKAFLLDTSRNWKLKIVGPWEISAGGSGVAYLESLKQLAAGSDLIEFVGPVYDAGILNNYYREAAIFLYPSIAEQGETFGLAPLEAMAWGCVPVVSDLACFKDFITDDVNGLVFNHRSSAPEVELRRKIDLVQNSPDIKKQMAQLALKVRQTHSTETISQAFVTSFKQFV